MSHRPFHLSDRSIDLLKNTIFTLVQNILPWCVIIDIIRQEAIIFC